MHFLVVVRCAASEACVVAESPDRSMRCYLKIQHPEYAIT